MAHELDRNEATGAAAMFSVKETPWHREGFVLDEPPTYETAKHLGGWDFEVAAVPVYVEALDGSGAMVKAQSGRAIIRTDRPAMELDRVFAVRSDQYVPLQNDDAFSALIPLIDSGVATIETGGTLRGGRDVWMMVKFAIDSPVVREVFADEVIPFGLITNNHSGEARAEVAETAIRVVCANTLGFARSGLRYGKGGTAIAVTHRGDAKVRMIDAATELFGGIVERYEVIARQYRQMKETIITVEQFTESVLDVVAPYPPKAFTVEGDHLTQRGYAVAYEAADDRRSRITQAWETGKGHVGDRSAWEAYNGAVEVIDHDVIRFRTRGSRVASMIGGRLAERKQALANAVGALCGVEFQGRK